MTLKKGYRGYWKGKHLSEGHKEKISKALKGHSVSGEHRRIISEARKGKPLSAETKKKISEAHEGKHLSKEHRRKLSLSRQNRSGENQPFYGGHHSEETRRRMSETRKGHKTWNKGLTKETDSRVKRLSEAISGENSFRYGKKPWNSGKMGVYSEKTLRKISEAGKGRIPWNRGKTMSKEYRRKLSEMRFGKNNSQWLGGKSFEPYGLEFNDELKKQIRERDNYQCQLCGLYEEEFSNSLSVHHIDYDKENNDPQNLVSLHDSCHAKTNVNRDYWEAYFKGVMAPLSSPILSLVCSPPALGAYPLRRLSEPV